jgi:hypothetical protein
MQEVPAGLYTYSAQNANNNLESFKPYPYSRKQSIAFLYAFFWVIPRRLNFICRSFGTLYLFHLSVLWVAYATHSTLIPVPTLPR